VELVISKPVEPTKKSDPINLASDILQKIKSKGNVVYVEDKNTHLAWWIGNSTQIHTGKIIPLKISGVLVSAYLVDFS
jgi:hypothetical protein